MRSKCVLTIIFALVALMLASLACRTQATSPTPDLASIVAQTQTAIALDQLVTATTAAKQAPPTEIATLSVSTPKSPLAPTPTETSISTPPDCTNKAKFVNETIPDNTVFPPGDSFIKTWSLRNVGTCTWTPDYSIVHIKGEQMGGTSPSPIGETVPPNEIIQLFLPQMAPQDPGNYQGFWKLRSTSGEDFGLGENADVAFWVKIEVKQGAKSGDTGGNLNLGAPSWVETFEGSSTAFDLGSDSNTNYELKNGNLVMTAIAPAGDLWRISSGYLRNFAMEGYYKTGPNCSGKDSYGMIVRAPNQPDSIIDSGYVFAFACEGRYRVYRMDNGNFNGITNWTADTSIKAGSNQDNKMLIKANGDNIQLYANGQLIFQFTDSTYSDGLFGLMIRSEVTPNFKVLVEQIAYWDIDP